MKDPAEYLKDALSAHYSFPLTDGCYQGMHLPKAVAEAAIVAALADAAEYRRLLLKALKSPLTTSHDE